MTFASDCKKPSAKFSYSRYANHFLEDQLKEFGNPDQTRGSQYRSLISTLLEEGVKYGQRVSLDELDFANKVADPICRFVDQLSACFVEREEPATARVFWQHKNNAAQLIFSSRDIPQIDRSG